MHRLRNWGFPGSLVTLKIVMSRRGRPAGAVPLPRPPTAFGSETWRRAAKTCALEGSRLVKFRYVFGKDRLHRFSTYRTGSHLLKTCAPADTEPRSGRPYPRRQSSYRSGFGSSSLPLRIWSVRVPECAFKPSYGNHCRHRRLSRTAVRQRRSQERLRRGRFPRSQRADQQACARGSRRATHRSDRYRMQRGS